MIEIRPQHGPQEMFLRSDADIGIYGGAAGGGKTYALLMEPLYHVNNPLFGATIFRRTQPQITAEGGLKDTSVEVYAPLKAVPTSNPMRWKFGSGAKIEFRHLQHEKNIYDWQGSQIPLIEYDELTHFTEKQFFYLLSRNRSTCGVRPYVRAACNPDPDSWVKTLISWWLDDEGEYADESKSGKKRWMLRVGDTLYWFDTKVEAGDYAVEIGLPELMPKSVTFIPSSVYDNELLLQQNPDYLSNLMALPRVERERLEKGNWKIRATAGTIFSRDDFEIVDAVPLPDKIVRCWDRAATLPNPENHDPDWTAGVKMQRTGDTFFILDVNRFRAKPGGVERRVKNTASQDGKDVIIVPLHDPGQAGKSEIHTYYKLLMGYPIYPIHETTKKYLRWRPFAAQAQAGNVKLLRGDWNDAFLNELENLSEDPKEYSHDDQGDASAGAFMVLTGNTWRPVE